HQRRAAHQQRPRAKLQEAWRAPQHHQALAATKWALHQAKGREVQLTPDRAPKPSVSRRGPTNAKATLAHTSPVPILNDLVLINPAQAKRRQEHIPARKRANAKQVARPGDPKDNNNSW